MSLEETIRESFTRSFKLYDDLIRDVREENLSQTLQPHRSNALGEQLWCVVGARETYARSIAKKHWTGFRCSLENTTSRASVAAALERSAKAIAGCLEDSENFTATQNRMMLDLLEHEAAHHGQIIRYIYALKLTAPDSWQKKYALSDS